jgi:integrase/recombinase XerD
MIEDVRVRNLALNTQRSYVEQISRFARHLKKSPEQLGPEDIRTYQVYLINEKEVGAQFRGHSGSSTALCLKVSLKKKWHCEDVIPAPKMPQKPPVVLSPEEVLQFLGCIDSANQRSILTTCYAAGLRISEAVCLKIADINTQRMGHPCRAMQRPKGSIRNALAHATAEIFV